MKNFLTVKEVSKLLRIGRSGTYKLFDRTDFPKVTIGKKLLVEETDLENYLTKYKKSIIEL